MNVKVPPFASDYLVSDDPIETSDFEKMLIQDALKTRFDYAKMKIIYLRKNKPDDDQAMTTAVYLREALYMLLTKFCHRDDMPERED